MLDLHNMQFTPNYLKKVKQKYSNARLQLMRVIYSTEVQPAFGLLESTLCPPSQSTNFIVKGSRHDNCHQAWNPSGLSSGVASHHFVIVDSLLLERTLADTWPLGTHIDPPLPRGLLQFHCSLGTGWRKQGWWLLREITKALSKGNHVARSSFCFPCFLWPVSPYKQGNKC